MMGTILRTIIAAAIIGIVSEISRRWPRSAAFLLSLPLVSILAFLMSWTQHHDLKSLSRVARETLILVPLTLPFFLPLAFAEWLGLSFWPAFGLGVATASIPILAWLNWGTVCS